MAHSEGDDPFIHARKRRPSLDKFFSDEVDTEEEEGEEDDDDVGHNLSKLKDVHSLDISLSESFEDDSPHRFRRMAASEPPVAR